MDNNVTIYFLISENVYGQTLFR